MGLYTTQQRNTVGIFIAPTIDLAIGLESSEKGIVGAIGQVDYGYPFSPLILKENTLEIKSTLSKYGGSRANELAYHLQDFFTAFNGKVVLGRVLGDNSKTAYVSLGKENVFEDSNILDYDIFVINTKPTSTPYQIYVDYVGSTKILTIKAVDTNGTELWSEVGTSDSRNDYIGANNNDDKYIDVDSASEAFMTGAGDFSLISPIYEANAPIFQTTSSTITSGDYLGTRFFEKNQTLTAGAFPLQLGISANDDYIDSETIKLTVKYASIEDDWLFLELRGENNDVLYTVEGSTEPNDASYIGDKIDSNYLQLDADFTALDGEPFEIVHYIAGAYMQNFLGNIYTSSLSEIDIFGADGINEWEELGLDVGQHFQFLIKQCFMFRHSIKIDYKAKTRLMKIKLFDNHNREIYKIEGSIDAESKDDYGIPNYLPLLLDETILDLKIEPTHFNFNTDFVYIDTFEPYTKDEGIPQYDLAIENIAIHAEKMDYFMTAGLYDIKVIQDIWGRVLFKAKTPLIVDIPYSDSLNSAEKWVKALNLNNEYVVKLWNNAKSSFINGIQEIGLSGWYAGESIRKNLSNMVGDVESRLAYSIAGVDYPPPRNYTTKIPLYDEDELDRLVDARINTLRIINDVICLGDVLSSYPKWTPLRLFANAEAKAFLERYIARIIASKFFKNNNEALRFVRDRVRILFDDLDEVGTFNKEHEIRKAFKVALSDEDLITVEYDCILAGVMRRGKIQGTVSTKITIK